MEYFYKKMTRVEVCRMYANTCGKKYGFVENSPEWMEEYEYAYKQTDKYLKKWCEVNLG